MRCLIPALFALFYSILLSVFTQVLIFLFFFIHLFYYTLLNLLTHFNLMNENLPPNLI